MKDAEQPIGAITSGGFGPTVGGPIAMGYVDTEIAADGTESLADRAGHRAAARVSRRCRSCRIATRRNVGKT